MCTISSARVFSYVKFNFKAGSFNKRFYLIPPSVVKTLIFKPMGGTFILGIKMAKSQRAFPMRMITCTQLVSYVKLIFNVVLTYKRV